MLFKVAVLCAVAAGLAGCVTAKPGAERIQLLSNPELVKGCKFLRQDSAYSWGLPTDMVRSSVIAQIQDKALDAGGTHVLTPGPVILPQGPNATLNGDIYRCG